MPNVILAGQLLTNLLVLIGNGIDAAAKYNAIVQKARAEGRDITADELDLLRAASHDIATELAAKLRTPL